MCPPASGEIGEDWTDEGIFTSLLNLKSGSPLPSNVISDLNPYQYRPADLPADLWYLCSRVKKDAECGFWLETGEACEMFSNSSILGTRTTLQFYEGHAPNERKTDWMMQEYRITDKFKDNPKEDHRALCRVFLCDEHRPPSDHSIAKTENSSDMDCIMRGDYFELNDLVDEGYHSSSSTNSSCLTMTSEEYFDSLALLQELDNDIADSKMKFNLSAPVKSKQVVISPPTSVVLRECEEKTSKVDDKNESTSNTTSSWKSRSKERKKDDVGRTKRRKIIKYLCFLGDCLPDK